MLNLKTIEMHPLSLLVGAATGAIMCGVTVLILGLVMPIDTSLLRTTIKACSDKEPLYVVQAGEYVRVACNGHREGPK